MIALILFAVAMATTIALLISSTVHELVYPYVLRLCSLFTPFAMTILHTRL